MRRDVWRCHIGMDQIQVAFGWLRALADAGNAWGQFLLGSLLLKGIDGVQEKEAPQGVALLVRSVEGGFAAAQNALGLLHAKGEGMKQNLEESTRLYRWVRTVLLLAARTPPLPPPPPPPLEIRTDTLAVNKTMREHVWHELQVAVHMMTRCCCAGSPPSRATPPRRTTWDHATPAATA